MELFQKFITFGDAILPLCAIIRDTLKVTRASSSDDKKEKEGVGSAGKATGEGQPKGEGEREESLAGGEVGQVPHSVRHPGMVVMLINTGY